MRDYILNGEDIEKIIKTGKFEKEKYAEKLLVYGITAEDLVNNSGLEENKENIEKAYNVFLNDEIIDDIWKDLIDKM